MLSVRTASGSIKAKENYYFVTAGVGRFLFLILVRLTVYLLNKIAVTVSLLSGGVVRNTACRAVVPGSIPAGVPSANFFSVVLLHISFFPSNLVYFKP